MVGAIVLRGGRRRQLLYAGPRLLDGLGAPAEEPEAHVQVMRRFQIHCAQHPLLKGDGATTRLHRVRRPARIELRDSEVGGRLDERRLQLERCLVVRYRLSKAIEALAYARRIVVSGRAAWVEVDGRGIVLECLLRIARARAHVAELDVRRSACLGVIVVGGSRLGGSGRSWRRRLGRG